jgi:hypothetical protein
MARLGIIVIASILLAGCETTPKILITRDADRAAGTVTLSTTAGGLEIWSVNWEESNKVATQSCRGWGYSDATPLGSYKSSCAEVSTSNYRTGECIVYRYDYTYQCLGGPTSNVNIINSDSQSQSSSRGLELVESLNRLEKLYNDGLLSEEEFNAAKRRLLGL